MQLVGIKYESIFSSPHQKANVTVAGSGLLRVVSKYAWYSYVIFFYSGLSPSSRIQPYSVLWWARLRCRECLLLVLPQAALWPIHTQWIGSSLVQIMACHLPALTSSHQLNQWWIIANWNLKNKLQWSFNQNMQLSSQKMHLKMLSANVCHFVEAWVCELGQNLPHDLVCQVWQGGGSA